MGRVMLLLVALAGFTLALYAIGAAPPDPLPVPWRATTQPVTTAENARVWSKANSALGSFIAAGLRGGEDGVVAMGRADRRDESNKMVTEFAQAVETLRRAAPPGEQAPIHETLLPIYVEMRDQMTRVVEAASSEGSLSADLEWQKLALLVEEAGEASEMLSSSDTWVVVANTDGEGVFLRGTPQMADRLAAWPEGTRLRVVGVGVEGEDRRWIPVVDPRGQVGWVPEAYVKKNVGY